MTREDEGMFFSQSKAGKFSKMINPYAAENRVGPDIELSTQLPVESRTSVPRDDTSTAMRSTITNVIEASESNMS